MFEELEEFDHLVIENSSPATATKGSCMSKADSARIRDDVIEKGYKENEELDILFKELKLRVADSAVSSDDAE